MCEGFGCIVDKELNLYFCEPDSDDDCSHSEILRRLGWRENNDPFISNFVQVEFADWMTGSFRFDDDIFLPGWCEGVSQEIQNKASDLLLKCLPAWIEYQKVRVPAWTEYQKVRDIAWIKYQKVRKTAQAEMLKKLSKIGGYVPEGRENEIGE